MKKVGEIHERNIYCISPQWKNLKNHKFVEFFLSDLNAWATLVESRVKNYDEQIIF